MIGEVDVLQQVSAAGELGPGRGAFELGDVQPIHDLAQRGVDAGGGVGQGQRRQERPGHAQGEARR